MLKMCYQAHMDRQQASCEQALQCFVSSDCLKGKINVSPAHRDLPSKISWPDLRSSFVIVCVAWARFRSPASTAIAASSSRPSSRLKSTSGLRESTFLDQLKSLMISRFSHPSNEGMIAFHWSFPKSLPLWAHGIIIMMVRAAAETLQC